MPISGTAGLDFQLGSDDLIYGFDGADRLEGVTGGDIICGGSDADIGHHGRFFCRKQRCL